MGAREKRKRPSLSLLRVSANLLWLVRERRRRRVGWANRGQKRITGEKIDGREVGGEKQPLFFSLPSFLFSGFLFFSTNRLTPEKKSKRGSEKSERETERYTGAKCQWEK